MATVQDIVQRAFRKASLIGEGDPLSASEAAEGRDTLNSMIHAWKLEGLASLSWDDQELTDTFALDPEYHEGVIYMLAGRLSHDYTAPLAFDPDEWFRAIQAAHIVIPSATIPSALKCLPSSFRGGYTRRGSSRR